MSILSQRIAGRIIVGPKGCWLYTGSTTGAGYGQIGLGKRKFYTHRVMYEEMMEPIPDGLQVDHLCRVRSCCRPSHLQVVTNRENTVRGRAADVNRARMLGRPTCRQGHLWTPENTYIRRVDGQRQYRECRACGRARMRARRALREAS